MWQPEWVSLYLLLGLGVAVFSIVNAGLELSKKPVVAVFQFVIVTIVGTLLGMFMVVIWPTFFMSYLLKSMHK